MNKTTMTLAAALALGASAFTATPHEMVAAKDWEALSMCSFATITNYMPKANAADVYAACLATNVNYWKAARLALLGYAASPEQCYNDLKSKWPTKEAFGSAWEIVANKNVNNLAWQLELAEEASKAQTTSQKDFACNVLVHDNKLKTNEAEFLRIASEALARGDFVTACAPIFAWPRSSGWEADETETLKAWRDANASAIMTGLAEMDMVPEVCAKWKTCMFNLATRDLAVGDRGCSYAMRFFNPKFYDTKLGKYGAPSWFGTYLTDWTFGKAQLDAFMKNSTDAKLMYKYLTKRINKTDRSKLFKMNFEKFATDPNVAFKVAIEINDVDKMLDALVASTNGLTPEEITAIIENVVALDVDYRAADVVKILKNINAKYTLKLYDDRDTWEPILSKIRALIDTRL